MMYNIGVAFLISVLTLYTFYRYFFDHQSNSEFYREIIWIQLKLEIISLIYTLLVICIASWVKKEVSLVVLH